MLERIRKHPWMIKASSLDITLVCLILLFLLTGWGTFHQKFHGLYDAQQKFFHSWIFFTGYLPFPGGKLVMWILSINLIASAVTRYRLTKSKFGILTIHWGFIVLLFGSFITHYWAEESYLALKEGASSNVSLDRRIYETAVWQEISEGRDVSACAASEDAEMYFAKWELKAKIIRWYDNARPGTHGNLPPLAQAAASYPSLIEVRRGSEPEEDSPAAVVELELKGVKKTVLLWGGDGAAWKFNHQGKELFIALQHRRYAMPAEIKLGDFVKKEHTGTAIASSFESHVRVTENGSPRDVKIYMNNPLRIGAWTFYQSSFMQSQQGETSVLAVVKNHGRLLPYISSGMVFFGLLWHFFYRLTAALTERRRQGTSV